MAKTCVSSWFLRSRPCRYSSNMPSPEPKPLRDFYEKGQELLEEARNEPDPDLKKLMYEVADRYFKADIDLAIAEKTASNKIGDLMAGEGQPTEPTDEARHVSSVPNSTSRFFGFLEQALFLGGRGIRQTALPKFIGYFRVLSLCRARCSAFHRDSFQSATSDCGRNRPANDSRTSGDLAFVRCAKEDTSSRC
jgi:hypothetical protein